MKQMSPFYPHGHIPVPGMEGAFSASVEGIWQGLKVFEGEGIDRTRFANKTMLNLKRTCRTHGCCLGHMYNGELMEYIEAERKSTFRPTITCLSTIAPRASRPSRNFQPNVPWFSSTMIPTKTLTTGRNPCRTPDSSNGMCIQNLLHYKLLDTNVTDLFTIL